MTTQSIMNMHLERLRTKYAYAKTRNFDYGVDLAFVMFKYAQRLKHIKQLQRSNDNELFG